MGFLYSTMATALTSGGPVSLVYGCIREWKKNTCCTVQGASILTLLISGYNWRHGYCSILGGNDFDVRVYRHNPYK